MSRAPSRSSFRAASVSLVAVAFAALAACGPNGAAPKQCGTAQVICDGQCVDLANDTGNCGLCGNVCTAPGNGGSVACVSGVCAPTCSGGGLALCNAEPAADGGLVTLSCTDTDVDPNHCGNCDTVCGPNQNCDNGVCTGCPSGMLRCPAGAGMPEICLAILSDNDNCGGCGTACGSGTYCDNGACVATGDNNCGNPDGGVANSTDLQTDRYNCGQCGVVCGNSETCTSGRCEPCALAQCGNACTDTTSDPANCGGCGVLCTAGQVCVDSACAVGVRVEMLGPADGGFVEPSTPIYQLVQTESALPIANLTVTGPVFGTQQDGGAITSSNASYIGALPQGAVDKLGLWEIAIPAQNPDAGWNGVITATAYDTAWSSAGSSAAQHLGTAAAVLHYAGAIDGGFVPRLTMSAGGVALDAGVFIPLGAQQIVLSTQAPDPSLNVGAVQFVMINGSRQLVLGTAQRSGNSEVLQVDADQMLVGSSVIEAIAYAQDGQTFENVSPSVPVQVGSVTNSQSNAPPALLIDDAGTPSLWWIAGAAGASGATSGAVVSAPYNSTSPGVPDAGVTDAGFLAGQLYDAPDLGSIYSVTTGGEIVRFQCQSGFNCVQRNYVIGVQAAQISQVTSTSMAIIDRNNKGWFAPATSGTALSAGGSLDGTWQFNDGSFLGLIAGPNTTRSSDVPANQTQLVVYSPAAGVLPVGDPMPSSPTVSTFGTGEFTWTWQDATGHIQFRAGAFVANQLHLTATAQIASNAVYDAYVPRPGFISGGAQAQQVLNDGGIQALQITPFIADTAAGTISFPVVAANPQSGPLELPYYNSSNDTGVGTRNGFPSAFAVSDDQLKEIAVTADSAPALDGGTETDYTLWLIDLPGHAAAPVYSTPRMLPFAAPDLYTGCGDGTATSNSIAPHFVHSAAGQLLSGGAPSGSVAAVPAVVFDELLDPPATNNTSPSTYPVRLYAAKYGTGVGPSAAQAVDRFASLTVGSLNNNTCDLLNGGITLSSQPYPLTTNTPFEAETAQGGGAFLFIGNGAGSDTTLYAAPLFGSGPLVSTRVLDSATDFRTREDTGRLLALRADGNLYAGQLGQAPSLSLALTGGNGGPPPLGTGAQAGFGFTADGNHAWMAVQGGGAENPYDGSITTSILEQVDLSSSQRTDFGSLAYGTSNLLLPVLFLANGATAFGLDPAVLNGQNGSDVVQLWGATSASGQGTHHYESGLTETVNDSNDNQGYQGTGWLGIFEPTTDGNEGRILLSPLYYSDYGYSSRAPAHGPTPDGIGGYGTWFDGSVAYASKDGTQYNGALSIAWNGYETNDAWFSTWSPYGAPYAPDFELFQTSPGSALQATARGVPDGASVEATNLYYFKQWSSAASNGVHPAKLLTSGADYVWSTVVSPDQSRLGVWYYISGQYAPAFASMAPHPAAQVPLP